MCISSLDEAYRFLVKNIGVPELNTGTQNINLIPLSNIDYRDKIRGTMLSLAIGDIFGAYWEGKHKKEIEYINHFLKGEKNNATFKGIWQTESTILTSESLIINQSFNPEDLANRLIKQPIMGIDKVMEEFVTNYRDKRLEWYKSGVSSTKVESAIRGVPIALISYGDFNELRLASAIQTAITHVNETAIVASILFSTAISYLLNTPAFSIESKEDINLFINTISASISGIETKIYPIGKNREIGNLYTMISKILKEWIYNDYSIEEIKDEYGSSSNSLESIPLSLYIFIKNINDYEKALKESLFNRKTDTIVTMVLTLLGAYLGLNNIPKAYVKKLNNSKELLTLSDRLFELSLKNKSNNPYRRMRDAKQIEKSQDELDKLLWQGIKYNQKEEYGKAVTTFEELIDKSSELKKNDKIKLYIIEAYEGAGNKFLEEEEYEKALKYFKKGLIYDLNNSIILSDIAITYLYMDDLNKAEKYAQRSVESSPEYEIGREILEGIQSLKKKK